jgi:hypothetical protein
MPLTGYEDARLAGRLVQGEVLGPVWEYVPLIAPVELPAETTEIPVRALRHPRMLLLTQDCDLEQDFSLRFPGGDVDAEPAALVAEPGAVPHVLLCDLFEDLRSRVAGGDIFKRARRNQDERYHALPSVPIAGQDVDMPELFADFRHAIALPTEFVYAGVRGGGIERRALLPELFRLDFVHRFHAYQARVPVP